MTGRFVFDADLTGREIELVELLSFGRSNNEIARELNITANTVKTHIARITRKLGTPSRAGIVGECFRRGYLNTEEAG